MYLGTLEIEKVEDNIVSFTNGQTIQIEEKNKELISEEPLTGGELQMKWAIIVAKDVLDIFVTHNIRLTDINLIMDTLSGIISGKNDEAVSNAFGKEKLDTISNIFGSDQNLASLAVRNIRVNDIFKS